MQVSDFKNKHKGEIAFLLGGGPSLHYVDTDLIENHVCIAVNSGIVKHFSCNYVISDDYDITSWTYYNDYIDRYSSTRTNFLYKKKFENKCSSLENTVLFEHKSWFSPENKSYNFDGLRLTKEEPIIGARLSMGSAVHISYIMGANPIVLLGNDCQLSKGKKYRYFWQFPGEQKQFRVKGRKFTYQTQNRGFNKDSFVEYWNYFAEANKDILGKEVDIIDASDSCLDCFPKMSIREVLDKYGEKNE